jgi:hypothetical protein
VLPSVDNLATKASLMPDSAPCSGLAVGKSAEKVYPAATARPAPSTATARADILRDAAEEVRVHERRCAG